MFSKNLSKGSGGAWPMRKYNYKQRPPTLEEKKIFSAIEDYNQLKYKSMSIVGLEKKEGRRRSD